MPGAGDVPPTLSVAELYAPGPLRPEQVDALLDASLAPRGPEILFARAAELGLADGRRVLDVGCRDGRQLLELRRRCGGDGVGLEPLADNLAKAPPDVVAASPPVHFVRGVGEALPFAGASFDLVWIRDVLVHVEALSEALAEARRVLRPGGAVLIFQMFATAWLEPAEAARLWPPLAVVPANTGHEFFEQAIARAGLRIESRDDLTSEWREHGEEHDAGRTSRQLLWSARLLRRPDHYRAVLGERDYAAELANCLWGVYQMIGKLSPSVYVLRASS
jgi:ubiquinone/menaquinone biosynthesis C-methylase UbiE